MSFNYKSVIILLFALIFTLSPLYANSNPDSEHDNSFFLPTYPNGTSYQIKPLDLNGDGFNDILFSTGTTSRIFWGSRQGYSNDSKTDILSPSAGGVCVADLNKDEYQDIVFACFSDKSYIYWGSKNGFSNSSKTELETANAWAVSVSDLNKDGWLDIVFANYNEIEGSSSFIYYGGPGGFSKSNRVDLPTRKAFGVTISDLNNDGWPDIVFCNYNGTKSYIYWGSASGFSISNRSDINTVGAGGVSVRDLNNDGFKDIVFGNSDSSANSYIYWGSASGYSNSQRSLIPSSYVYGASVEDLNKDGYLDIVLTSYSGASKVNSYIYWGSPSGYSASNRTLLPTKGTAGVGICDLNKDGWLDIVFSNSESSTSTVYWGGPLGYSIQNKTEFLVTESTGVTVVMQHYNAFVRKELPMEKISLILGLGGADRLVNLFRMNA